MKDEYRSSKDPSGRGDLPLRGYSANSVSLSCSGATLFEYIVVLVCLGFSVYGALVYFQPDAAMFHNEMKGGMGTSYPESYVGELTPTPTTAPTATPAG